MHQSHMSSSSSLHSLSSSSSFSCADTDYTLNRGFRPAMVFTNQDMPFQLKMMSRSSRYIHWGREWRWKEVRWYGNCEGIKDKEIDKKVLEKEIQVKLS